MNSINSEAPQDLRQSLGRSLEAACGQVSRDPYRTSRWFAEQLARDLHKRTRKRYSSLYDSVSDTLLWTEQSISEM